MYNKDMLCTPTQNQKEEFFSISEQELGLASQTASTASQTGPDEFFMLKWTIFDVNNPTTWPKDNKEVMATVLGGAYGIPNRFVWFAEFDHKCKKWSNCDCGEVVIAWSEKPKPYEGKF